MNKKELIIGIFGLVLVFAIIVTFVGVLGNLDKITEGFGDLIEGSDKATDDTSNGTTNSTDKPSTGTDKPSTETNKPSTETNKPSDENPDTGEDESVLGTNIIYDHKGNADIGYITVDDVTYFFVAQYAPEDKNNGMCFDKWTVKGTCEISQAIPYYSIDEGLTWNKFNVSYDPESYTIDGCPYVDNDQSIYVTFSVQENCSDPESVLDAYPSYIGHKNSYYYGDEGVENYDCIGCGGIYEKYESAFWYPVHQFDQYTIGGGALG